MTATDFDPRQAALQYAGQVGDESARASVNAIACGLVYVGDEIAAQRRADARRTDALIVAAIMDLIMPSRPSVTIGAIEQLAALLDPGGTNTMLRAWARQAKADLAETSEEGDNGGE